MADSESSRQRGRKMLLFKTRRCLTYLCGELPFTAGLCKGCYYKRYRMNVVKNQQSCKTPHCPLTPRTRGYCYACCKNNPNPKPRKQKNAKKLSLITNAAQHALVDDPMVEVQQHDGGFAPSLEEGTPHNDTGVQ